MEKNSRVMLILNIKLDNTKTDHLEVLENENPAEAAEKFCKKHDLSPKVKQELTRKIEENLKISSEAGKDKPLQNPLFSGAKLTDKPSTAQSRSASAKNYGEILYEKGIMMKQKVDYNSQLQKQIKIENEMKNVTFSPKINTYVNRKRNMSSKSVCRSNKKALDESVYTFKPKINNYRLKTGENHKKSDKCIELYNSSKYIQKKRDEKNMKIFNETCTFQPNVFKNNNWSPNRSRANEDSFLRRMKNQQNKSMFEMLKPNFKGCITKATVQSVSLPREIHDRIGRIVYELIELDEELNFEEFCKAVDILDNENQSTMSDKLLVPDEFS